MTAGHGEMTGKEVPHRTDESLEAGRSPKRLLIDLSEVVHTDYGTGIHRVVRNLTRALLQYSGQQQWSCFPVAHSPDGQMHSACGYVAEKLGMQGIASAPAPAAGDVLLLLDSAWEHPERFLASIERARAAGGRVGAFVYDLIPLRFPQYCVDFMPPIFERWLRFVIANCDFLICISRSVADDLESWIGQFDPPRRHGLRIGHVHLGSDISEAREALSPSLEAINAMRGGRSVLMVGTIEPRKRHDLALAAFEHAWDAGADLRLVVMGKQGWHMRELVERINSHVELGNRLFWMASPSDADLEHAYANAARLLQASDAEGFGLPIVEAARHGTPLLLSDIPVFREIAGGEADYFAAGDARALQACISPGSAAPRPSSDRLAITWQESAMRLLRLMEGGVWDHEILDA